MGARSKDGASTQKFIFKIFHQKLSCLSFFVLTTTYITEFCKNCPTCQLQQPKKEQPPLKPIIAQDFMERIQIDLIDMRHSPDGDFNYIGHFEDHMTKFHILFLLRDKSANYSNYN